MAELVSVVIPAHGAERFIRRTLISVLRQSHRAIEVLVVDDGSRDRTVDIVRKIASADPRVVLFERPHQGVSSARNFAMARARGRFVAPLDADDLWHRDKLARQLAVMQAASPEVGVVYCWASGIDDRDRVVLPVWNASHAAGDVLHDIVMSGILSNGSTPLIRREAITAVGGYDEQLSLCEDWKFYTALAGVCRFAVIPECLTGYRLRPDSASVNVGPMEVAIAQVTRWIQATWPDLPQHVFRERAYTVNTYLAFLAARAGRYRQALQYLGKACRAKPRAILDLSIARYLALIPAEALGLRRYQWQFWRTPEPFPQ